MVYKKYIKRNGKIFGPYYYESYRENGKVKTRFVAGPKDSQKKPNKLTHKFSIFLLLFISLFFLLIIFGNINYKYNISGRVIQEENDIKPTEIEKDIAEQIAKNELVSNTDIRKIVEPRITEPWFYSKFLEFDSPNGNIELDFDLLNYNTFIEKDSEEKIEKENFDIQVSENADRYKWGYNVKLHDLNFMAKITLKSEKEIVIIDNQTFRVGNSYLSFADLTERGYFLTLDSSAIKEIINSSNITEQNNTIINFNNITEEFSENITEIKESDSTELNKSSEEEINDTEITDKEKKEKSEKKEKDDENETINAANETEVNNKIGDNDQKESAEFTENINENSSEELADTNISESKYEKEVDKEKEERKEKDASDEASDILVSNKTQDEENKLDENSASDKQISLEELLDAKEDKESENLDIVGVVATNIIQPLGGFIVQGITGLSTIVEEKHEVTIYLQKNFTDSNYSVGDIINLDPTIIILITNAEHLDGNKNFIEDIYPLVKEKDNNWTTIPNNNFVRVTFEKNLTSENDITLFARSTQPTTVEVYTKDSSQLITQFENIQEENWYKVFLNNLAEGENYSTFDLKIITTGNFEVDYIVDPLFGSNNISLIDPTPANATSTSNSSVLINVSIDAGSLNEIKWSWNITNFTIYHPSTVLFINFDNRSDLAENDSYIFDVSNAKNNGTVVGDLFDSNSGVNCTDAKSVCSRMFDGVGDYINFTTGGGTLSSFSGLTISTWIYYKSFDNSANSATIISKNSSLDNDNSGGYRLRIIESTNVPKFSVYYHITLAGDYVMDIDYQTALTPNNWYYLTATFDHTGSFSAVYLNGINDSGLKVTSENYADIDSNTNLTIGVSATLNDFFNGSIDNLIIYNRSLNASEVYQLYASNLYRYNSTDWYLTVNQSKNTSNGLDAATYNYYAFANDGTNQNRTEIRTITITSGSDTTPPVSTLRSPANNSYNTTGVTTFECNATDETALQNITLYVWNSSSGIIVVNNTNVTGTSNSSNFTFNFGFDNTTLWNCLATDSSSNRDWSINRTLTIDGTPPLVTITNPSKNNSNVSYTSLDINFTVVDSLSGLASCWYSNDTYLVNKSLGSAGTCTNLSNITWSEGLHNVTIYVNDSAGNLNFTTITFRIDTIPPTIPFVEAISAVTPIEASPTTVSFIFSLNDSIGVAHLNNTSVRANFSKSGETTRFNSSCLQLSGQNTSISQNYSCILTMWYFDGSGTWTINTYGEDLAGNAVVNSSTSFTYNQLKALVISPSEVTFNVTIAGTNITSNQNTTINNTGNYNATGNLSLNAINLYAGTTYIDVGNFTVDIEANVNACDGTFLQNNTYKNVTGAVLEKGNLSLGVSNETFYYCFTKIPQVASGNYNTDTAGSWTIRINLIQLLIKKYDLF